MKPHWSDFWTAYPDYITWRHSDVLKRDIGGSVDASWITNTCAVRLSRGLNYSGVPVPGNRAGLLTVKGGDDLRYALRVAEMRLWLPHVLGPADIDLRKKKGEAFDKTTLASSKGIIAFDISFSDATGHLDAWDGKTFSDEHRAVEYWTKATRITLWKLI